MSKSVVVKTWQPAPDCPQCKRAEEIQREQIFMRDHLKIQMMNKIREQSRELSDLRNKYE